MYLKVRLEMNKQVTSRAPPTSSVPPMGVRRVDRTRTGRPAGRDGARGMMRVEIDTPQVGRQGMTESWGDFVPQDIGGEMVTQRDCPELTYGTVVAVLGLATTPCTQATGGGEAVRQRAEIRDHRSEGGCDFVSHTSGGKGLTPQDCPEFRWRKAEGSRLSAKVRSNVDGILLAGGVGEDTAVGQGDSCSGRKGTGDPIFPCGDGGGGRASRCCR